MDELIIKETMSSLQIAEISGKHHKDVMRAIRKMEPAWEKICGRKFALTSQIVDMPNGGTRKESCYILNKTECLFIATKFNDEARAILVLRWEELERKTTKTKSPSPTFPTLPKLQEHGRQNTSISSSSLWRINGRRRKSK